MGLLHELVGKAVEFLEPYMEKIELMTAKAAALENITANVGDSGPGLVMANKGDYLKIIRKVNEDTYEVVLEKDPEAVSFYATRRQLVIY